MLPALCSAARPGYGKAMGTHCLGNSCRAGGLVNSSHECRTGQVSRAVSHTLGFPGLMSDIDWRLHKSSVSELCSQSPSVALPAGSSATHLWASWGLPLGCVRGSYIVLLPPLVLYMLSDTCAFHLFRRTCLQFTVPGYLGTRPQGPSEHKG